MHPDSLGLTQVPATSTLPYIASMFAFLEFPLSLCHGAFQAGRCWPGSLLCSAFVLSHMRRLLQLALGVISVAAVRFPPSPFDQNWLNWKSKPKAYPSRTSIDSRLVFQDPLSRPYYYDEVEAVWTMDAPPNDLDALSEKYYTRLIHPAFPQHSVRIRRTKHFCEPNARYVQMSPFTVRCHLIVFS